MVSTHLKNISQIGSFSQVGVKIKNIWNHHLVMKRTLGKTKKQMQALSTPTWVIYYINWERKTTYAIWSLHMSSRCDAETKTTQRWECYWLILSWWHYHTLWEKLCVYITYIYIFIIDTCTNVVNKLEINCWCMGDVTLVMVPQNPNLIETNSCWWSRLYSLPVEVTTRSIILIILVSFHFPPLMPGRSTHNHII